MHDDALDLPVARWSRQRLDLPDLRALMAPATTTPAESMTDAMEAN